MAEKAQVNLALRRRGESFYAHLAEQMLHQAVAPLEFADFIPDARTLKQRDQHTLHTYLETRLAIAGYMPEIATTPSGSGHYLELQVADYLCSIVWSHFEYQNSEAFDLVKPHLRLQKLF